ncbi:MAG: HNH endonuclease [Chromatiaceae bacterium]|nr:HNH endonuclease [Chromatiaceae bacterium]
MFRNGDKRDIRLANLELISRSENMRRNQIHRYPPELKQVMQLAGKLRRAIDEKH